MFGLKYIKYQPHEYCIQYRNGRIIREGIGLSFYYYIPKTSLVKIPLHSVEVPFIFEEFSSDYQMLTIQGHVIYHIDDQKKLSELMNYAIDSRHQRYISEDPNHLNVRIMNQIQVLAKRQLGQLTVREAMKSGDLLAKEILSNIEQTEALSTLGIEILNISILAIRPTKETERALEATTREEILKQADEAIYERRNASILQEGKVKENEYNTQQALQLKHNQMETEQLAFKTKLEEKRRLLTELTVQNAKTEADSKAYAMKAMMDTFSAMDPSIIQSLTNVGMNPNMLLAVAFQRLADNADKIGQLSITPDLFQEIAKGRV
ncbi:MAG: SPFH domain-containing protein [Vallitaleaceae bacterium]|nr:SPFH domain-containing protein [Vallitaleaceae bacterium]